MRRHRLKLFLVMVLACFSSFSEERPYKRMNEQALFNGEKVIEYQLANGLTVLMVPRHQAEVVTFQMWFDVGSIHEKLDPKLKKTGLAHLFEHMMFRGTKRFGDGKFDELTSRMGATGQNATTYYYRTNYFESVPKNQLEVLFVLESDRMKNLKLSKELFEKEKGAVVGELRRALDNPTRIAYNELMKQVYKKEPFKYTVIGTEKEIKGFTLKEAKYFYRTYYAPNNSTIILVGDIEETEVIDQIVKYFGDMPSQKVPMVSGPSEPNQSGERRISKRHKQATSEILLMAYTIPPINDVSVAPLGVLGAHLSNGMESRLRKILVDTGVAVSASAGSGYRPNQFEFFVQMAEGKKAPEALKIIDREINTLRKKLISKKSFKRAMSQELLDLYSGIGSNYRMARMLGEYNAISGNYMRGFEIIEAYKAVTPANIRNIVKTYLIKKKRSIVIIKPGKKKGARGR